MKQCIFKRVNITLNTNCFKQVVRNETSRPKILKYDQWGGGEDIYRGISR